MGHYFFLGRRGLGNFQKSKHCWKKNQQLHSTLTFERNVVLPTKNYIMHNLKVRKKENCPALPNKKWSILYNQII